MIYINENDELKIYRGEDFIVSKHIKIHQPSLGEICNYGEREYYSMLHQLTATPQSMKFQLWDMGIDYTTIAPYQLFYNVLFKLFSIERTSIIFGDLDFSKFEYAQREDNDDIVLYQQVENGESHDDIVIDEYTYEMIVNYLRRSHFIIKDEKVPANETTKMVLIDDAREEYERNKGKEYDSQLKNLVSSMINSEGFKYNHSQVWEMKINAFMDSVKRISKIKDAGLLLQSGYSGYGINLKDIDKKQLDWLGELN